MKIIILFLILACSLSSYNSFAQTNTNYTISEKKGKFGYLKPNSKKWAIKPQFDGALAFGERLDSNFAFAKKDTLWGVIDKTGKWVVKPTYEAIFECEGYSKSLLGKRGNKNVFLSKKGDTLTPVFDYLTIFEDTKYLDSKYLSNTKKALIMIYNKNTISGFYEYLGNGLLKKIYGECVEIKILAQDIIIISKLVDGKLKKGLYNIASGKSTAIENDDITCFTFTSFPRRNTSFRTVNNGLYGILDKEFSNVLPSEYTYINPFGSPPNQFIVTIKNGKKGLLNLSNNKFRLLLNNEYKDVKWCTNIYFGIPLDVDSLRCYILKKDSLYGIYDKNKKQIVPYNLQDAYPTPSYNKEKPLIIFKQNNKVGIMNADTGEILIKPIYDQFDKYSEIYGLPNWSLVSRANKKFGRLYIKNNKIEEVKPIYDSISSDNEDTSTDINIESTFFWHLNKKKYKWNGKKHQFIPYIDKYLDKKRVEYGDTIISPTFRVSPYDPLPKPKGSLDEIPNTSSLLLGTYIVSKTEAMFSGRNGQSFEDFIIKNMKYPQKAIDNKIEGIVEMEITISKDAQITNIKITKSLGYDCDEEATRVVTLTNWNPPVFNGYETVTSIKRLKIVFSNKNRK